MPPPIEHIIVKPIIDQAAKALVALTQIAMGWSKKKRAMLLLSEAYQELLGERVDYPSVHAKVELIDSLVVHQSEEIRRLKKMLSNAEQSDATALRLFQPPTADEIRKSRSTIDSGAGADPRDRLVSAAYRSRRNIWDPAVVSDPRTKPWLDPYRDGLLESIASVLTKLSEIFEENAARERPEQQLRFAAHLRELLVEQVASIRIIRPNSRLILLAAFGLTPWQGVRWLDSIRTDSIDEDAARILNAKGRSTLERMALHAIRESLAKDPDFGDSIGDSLTQLRSAVRYSWIRRRRRPRKPGTTRPHA